MALTTFQKDLCRRIAANRIERGESYVAGGSALNVFAGGNRVSRDIDLFHDTVEALNATWQADRVLLEADGYALRIIHERHSYVEALVCRENEAVLVQWTCDSAYRFFPLVEHEDFGLVLHPVDLATNKVLAAVGRLEVRDWIDLITCHDRIQPLGYLIWAACGKDPAFSPLNILEQVGRSCRYTADEVGELYFEGPRPDMASLSRQWHCMLEEARAIIAALPSEHTGKCVLDHDGNLYRKSEEQLINDLKANRIAFHCGKIRGAFPQIVP